MRKLALVLALIGGLAACSKNKSAPATTPSNTAPESAPGETGATPDEAPTDDADGMGGGDMPAGSPAPSDPCSGGE
jgi:hypothetical protein